jgi:hypothetical protein
MALSFPQARFGGIVKGIESYSQIHCPSNFELAFTVRRLLHFFLALPSVSSPNLWFSNLYARTSGCCRLPCPGVAEGDFL